eukprot:38337-Chlamydomonas_euryale.AAC.5
MGRVCCAPALAGMHLPWHACTCCGTHAPAMARMHLPWHACTCHGTHAPAMARTAIAAAACRRGWCARDEQPFGLQGSLTETFIMGSQLC